MPAKHLFRILALCAVLAALLCGCSLRNRQPSSDFIPETAAPTATEVPASSQPPAPSATEPAQPEEIRVHEELTEGSYTDRSGVEYLYSYRLPLIDAVTADTNRYNELIDRQYRKPVSEQFLAMENYEPLTILQTDYHVRLRGDLLTLYLSQVDATGHQIRSDVFTFNRWSGVEATPGDYLDYLGLDDETFLARAEATVKAELARQAIDLSQSRPLSDDGSFGLDMPMYLDQDDALWICTTIRGEAVWLQLMELEADE